MPVTCPRCGTPARMGAPSCGGCGYVLASASGATLTLTFPAEHPVLDALPLDAQPPAPAPTLVPGPPPPRRPPPVSLTKQDDPRPQRKKTATVVGVVATVVAVGTVALVATTHGGSPTIPSGDTGFLAGTTENAPETSTTSPVPTDENSAQQMLVNQVANDRAQVEALVGSWVPQLSSKRLGLEVNGTTYGYLAIWSDFASLRNRYPGALLLWSGDYSSFRLKDFWVTVTPQPYGSGESANGWCDNAGIGKEDCYAKLITHTGSYADSTLLRE